MNANWISDGTPVPEDGGLPQGTAALLPPPVGREWQIGRFTFARAPRQGRWSCQVSDRGGCGYRTPFGAYFAVRRMSRKPQVTVHVNSGPASIADLAATLNREALRWSRRDGRYA